ncbi:hypothetical protein AX16_001585 [Volvariella volvacea WC 439]|nr:hypothetical protein AX16_001585 [Volvariella volvacea WC 439]
MTSPPGEPGSPSANAQPLPHQPTPHPASKPTVPATKKGRQRRQAESNITSATSSPPSVVKHPVQPFYPSTIVHSYPGPAFHIMNPTYPINGASYPQQPQHHPAYPPGHPQQPSPPLTATPPGMAPPAHQYPTAAYPVHSAQYPPPGYVHYPPQFPQPVMMYAHPRPSIQPDAAGAATPSSVQSAGQKRKRKSGADTGRSKGDKGSDEEASGSDVTRTQQQQPVVDMKKRTKTQRACDSCRARKIRCDILPDSEPQFCQHCKQYGFDCTFFLPITETRFKKKKEDPDKDKDKAGSASAAAPAANSSDGTKRATSSPSNDSNKRDIGIFGPTSTAHLLHSQATISSRIYENYDQRYHHTFEVSATGDGVIQVQKPTTQEQQQQAPHLKPVDLHIERDVIEKLINAYFNDVSPLLPVITREEFLANPNPPPILLYSMCLVAAARREVPQSIFDSIRFAVNNVIKVDDVLSSASIINVQSLLILCMTGDCHSQFVPNALSALWVRLGTAIRMAQDLGLHRCESVKQNITLRRRLWGACLISDRWTSLTYGHPYMIDVQDCDARLPSSGDINDLYMDELVRLSVILGRVLKTIYSPSGLTLVNDETLYQLLDDIEAWKANLPQHLQFRGPETPQGPGLLHLFYACVCMMFWRVFMRISYSCPTHLKFGLTVEKWTGLVELTSQAIDWLDAHEKMYDVWLLVAYAATSCALVQYHTWARRKDSDAAAKLRKLRDCVRRWEGSISPDHMSARRKTAEIIALLYEATQGPPLPIEQPALNPTGGVVAKPPPQDLDYKKDPSRPGGGIFVAHGKTKDSDYKDLPAGVVISSNSSDEASEGETSTEPVSSSVGVAASKDSDLASFFSSSPFAPPLPSTTTAPSNNPATFSNSPTNSVTGLPHRHRSSDSVNSIPAVSISTSTSVLVQPPGPPSSHTSPSSGPSPSNSASIAASPITVSLRQPQHHHQSPPTQQLHQTQSQNLSSRFMSGPRMTPVNAQLQATAGSPMVNFGTTLPGAAAGGDGSNRNMYTNLNPLLNTQQSMQGSVQLINSLDRTQDPTGLAELALLDNGFLEGIPGGMFDWSQWDSFFARVNAQAEANNAAAQLAAFQQQAQPPAALQQTQPQPPAS